MDINGRTKDGKKMRTESNGTKETERPVRPAWPLRMFADPYITQLLSSGKGMVPPEEESFPAVICYLTI